MKRAMRKATSLAMVMLFLASVCNTNTYAAGSMEPEITEKFVVESECSVVRDSIGATVIILTNVEPLPVASKSGENGFAKTSVAILPTDEEQAKEIISNIENLKRGSGSHTEDGWFYGSSVYLKSTVNYSTAVRQGGQSTFTLYNTVQ